MLIHNSHAVRNGEGDRTQTDSLHFNIAKLMSKSPDFKAGLLVIITALTTSSEWLWRNSALLVKLILAEKSQSARTAVANTVVLQQCTWICSPNWPYLLAFSAAWGKKNIWKEYNWPLKVKNRDGSLKPGTEEREPRCLYLCCLGCPTVTRQCLKPVWTTSFPFASELAEGVGRNQTAKEQSGHVLNLAFHTSTPATWYGVSYSWEGWISCLPGRSVHFISEIHLQYNPLQRGQTHMHRVPCLQDFNKI